MIKGRKRNDSNKKNKAYKKVATKPNQKLNMKNIKGKDFNDDDEEIESISSIEEESNDEIDNTIVDKQEKSTLKREFSKAMSADERRLLMAKTLIQSVGGDK